MTRQKVSVCIVTYNHARYIRDCVMSVIAQGHDADLEILVGDDRSTDGTTDIVAELAQYYPDQIKHVLHHDRLGRGSLNYRKLISLASGDFIAHLDGDDFWLPGKLREQLAFLHSHPDCAAVYTNALCVDKHGRSIGVFTNHQERNTFDLAYVLARGNFLNHSSLLYKSEMAGHILAWGETPFIDYRIALTFARHHDIGYMNDLLSCYRVNAYGSILASDNDFIRELYWAAVREALSSIDQNCIRYAALGNFLVGVFVRAREVRQPLFRRWWRVVTTDVKCNKLQLFAHVMVTAIRRRTLSLLTRRCGMVTGVPLRVIHRR